MLLTWGVKENFRLALELDCYSFESAYENRPPKPSHTISSGLLQFKGNEALRGHLTQEVKTVRPAKQHANEFFEVGHNNTLVFAKKKKFL